MNAIKKLLITVLGVPVMLASTPAMAQPVTYMITSGAQATGSISPSPSVSVISGASQTFIITPNPGYEVESILVDNTTYVTPSPTAQGNVFQYTFNNVTAPHSIFAYFSSSNPDYGAPQIVGQPQNMSLALPGSTAIFSVTASGFPSPSYQWYESTNGGSTFTAIGGATNAFYTTPVTTSSDNGTEFICEVLSPGYGFLSTNTAALTVLTATSPYVKVNGRQLVADFSGTGTNYQPYVIRGVDYSPTPIGRYSSDWGYYLSAANPNPSNLPNNVFADPNILNRDFANLKNMNVNTIRIWGGSDNLECGVSKVIFENAFPNPPTGSSEPGYGDNIYTWLQQNNYVDINGLVIANLTLSSTLNSLQAYFTDPSETTGERPTEYQTILSILQSAQGADQNPQNCGRLPNMITATTGTPYGTITGTLDTANAYGLKVIAGFYIPPVGGCNYSTGSCVYTVNSYESDSSNPVFNAPNGFDLTNSSIRNDILTRFKNYVNTFKNRPEILYWAIGNEINLSLELNVNDPHYSLQQIQAWYSLVDQMAQAAHLIEDPTGGNHYHPVAVVNGDDSFETIGNSIYGADDISLSNVDIWGVNIYRGQSFNDFFVQYKSLSAKPLWVSEYGIDAWQSCNTAANPPIAGCDPNDPSGASLAPASPGQPANDEFDQAAWDGSLWDEIAGNGDITIGASVMEYSDEWWKPNDWICNNLPYSEYGDASYCQMNHFYFGEGYGSHWPSIYSTYIPAAPDNYANEAWWGLMGISNSAPETKADTLTPRQAYTTLQTKFLNFKNNNVTLPSYLASPVQGATLNSASVTFAWSLGLGVSQYQLLVGTTSGGDNIYSYTGTATSATVPGIPLTGQTLYVQLGSDINGTWTYKSYTYSTLVQAAITITASAGANGSITPSGSVSVNYGANQTFTVTPNTGYTGSLTVDGITVTLTNNAYTLSDVIAAHTVVASFSQTLSPDGTTLSPGSTGSLVTTSGTWTFGSGDVILLNGNHVTGGVANLLLVYNQGKLYAEWNSIWYLWNGSGWNTLGGDPRIPLTPDGTTLSPGSTGSLVTTSGTWTFGSGDVILLNGNHVTGGEANLLLVYNQGLLYAEYNQIWYLWTGSGWNTLGGDPRNEQNKTITASAGSGGTITPSGAVTVSYGANQTFTVTPNTGYSIYQVYVDGLPQEYPPGSVQSFILTFIDVTSSHTIVASFINNIRTETITASAGANGTITPSGPVIVDYGANQIFTVTPSAGYTGILLVDGEPAALTNNTYTFSRVTAAHTIAASFSILTITRDGTTLSPGSTGSLVTSAGTWTFGSGDVILLNGKNIPGGEANLLLVYNGGQLYAEWNSIWYLWNGSGWNTLRGDPRTPPSVPTNLVAYAVSSSQINLTWTASISNLGVTGYKIFRNGTQVGTSTSASYSDTNLTAATMYSYTVLAYDATGNSSVQCSAVTAWTGSVSLSPDGTTLSPGSGGSLVSTSGTWAFGSGDVILLNGNHITGGVANLLLIYNQGKLYAEWNSIWYLWNGSGWNTLSGDPRVSLSPDGTILTQGSAGSLVTTSGTWTFGSGDVILLNGNHVTGGVANQLLVYNQGKLYAEYNAIWYLWNGSGWTTLSGDPRGVVTETITAGVTVDSGGAINPYGAVTVNYGANQTFTFTPSAGYSSNVSVDGATPVALPGNSYTFTDVITSHTIAASFSVIPLSPDGTTLSPGSTGSLISTSGTWTFGSGDVILLNGKNVTGGVANLLLIYNQGKLYAEWNSIWYLWNGTGWNTLANDPRTPLSPDGTTLSPGSTGSLVSTSGTWTFGSGDVILLNGKNVTGGVANLLLIYNQGKLYAEYNSIWYLWNGTGWNTLANDPRTPLTPDGTTLSPGSTGSLVSTSGTWTFGSGDVILLNGKNVTGGVANLLLIYNQGKLYAEWNSIWYLWNGSGWNTLSADPRNPQTKTITITSGTKTVRTLLPVITR